MAFDLTDYVTVPERVRRFYDANPEGRIVCSPPEVRVIGDRHFIEVTASVYRSPDDLCPCTASAWETFPGRTPYTKDSEMMNAETSAIGRAIAAAGIGVSRSMASRHEVELRENDRNAPVPTTKKRPPQDKPANKEVIDGPIAPVVERLNALVPPPARLAAKQGFAERFGHPSTITEDQIDAATEFVAEWEKMAPTFVAATPA
jgi:hypothetical protein